MSTCKDDCCCNCKNLFTLNKHPVNTKYKGSILEPSGLYACFVLDDDHKNRAILFDDKHGECELHERKEKTLDIDKFEKKANKIIEDL